MLATGAKPGFSTKGNTAANRVSTSFFTRFLIFETPYSPFSSDATTPFVPSKPSTSSIESEIALRASRNRRKLADLFARETYLCNEPRLSWSSDGTELVSAEEGGPNRTCRIIAISSSTGAKRFLTVAAKGVLADVEPVFSPNGRQLAFLRLTVASIADIFVMPRDGGAARRVTFDNREVRGLDWSADGKGLIFSSSRQGGFFNLWRIPATGGSAIRLTDSPVNLGFPSAGKQGNRMAYVAFRDDANIWRFRAGINDVCIASTGADTSPAYSPDGHEIAFVSDRTGNFEVWISPDNGSGQVQLTNFSNSPAGKPAWSPDGKRIAFDVRQNGRSEVYYLRALPGQKPEHLDTRGLSAAVPAWSHDGNSIYFASRTTGVWNIYRVPLAGGAPTQVTKDGGFRPIESPDGKFVYFIAAGKGIWRISTGPDAHAEPVMPGFPGPMWGNWAIGQAGIYFVIANIAPGARGSIPIQLLPWNMTNPGSSGERRECPRQEVLPQPLMGRPFYTRSWMSVGAIFCCSNADDTRSSRVCEDSKTCGVRVRLRNCIACT